MNYFLLLYDLLLLIQFRRVRQRLSWKVITIWNRFCFKTIASKEILGAILRREYANLFVLLTVWFLSVLFSYCLAQTINLKLSSVDLSLLQLCSPRTNTESVWILFVIKVNLFIVYFNRDSECLRFLLSHLSLKLLLLPFMPLCRQLLLGLFLLEGKLHTDALFSLT